MIENDSSRNLAVRLALLLISICFVMSANTLYCNTGNRSNQVRLCAICLICFIVVIVLQWLKEPIEIDFLQRWVLYALFVVISYLATSLFSGIFGGFGMVVATCNLAISPLFCKVIIKGRHLDALLEFFVDIVSFLAISSIVLWLLGPVLGVIASNCSIMSSWGGKGVFTSKPGWYGLLYVTQLSDTFGTSVARNTGIFCEAPMYSFVLCMALIFERFFRMKPRLGVLGLLGLTILTTLSTTGMILCLLVLVEWLFSTANKFNSGIRVLLYLALILTIVAIVALAMSLLFQKMDTASGVTRLDDFKAGFSAWMDNVLLGNGFAFDAIQKYMSGFRRGNLGFSSSPLEILAKGGVLWFLTFVPGIIGFARSNHRLRYGSFCFIVLWTVTIVSILPLTLFCFGLGACAAFSVPGRVGATTGEAFNVLKNSS
jgi:hypothetical protein